MRIQHNIMPMKAYGNYNNNTKALSGNLEKLSSGYKINRAGDDAAGLAISEKMRAQITGLEAAQKNVKDGISLVKTAEGAMQEVQDMLNRMDYLATQSANGTYDNEVDRANLQKEVAALKTEINRIADSANFNGIKLLDGSLSSKGKVAAQAEAAAALEAAQAKASAAAQAKTENGLNRMPTADIASSDKAHEVAGSKNIYDTTSASAVKGSFTIDLNTLKWNLDNSTMASTGSGTSVGAAGFTLTIGSGSKALKLQIDGSKTISTNTVYVVSSNGTSTATAGFVTATNVAKDLVNGAAGAAGAANATVTLNGVDWTMSAAGGVLTFTMKDKPTSASTARVDFNVKTSFASDTTANDGTVTMTGAVQAGTQPKTVGVAPVDGNRANTTFDIYASDITDGTVITVGTKSVTLKVGANGKATQGSTAAVIDLTAYEAGSLSDAQMHDILSKIVKGIGTNVNHTLGNATGATFEVGVGSDGHSIRIQRNDNKTANIYTTKEDLAQVFKIKKAGTTLDISKEEAAAAASNFKGDPLTLQIGDTSDDFNQMKVDIGDIHVGAMGIIGSNGTVEDGKSIDDVDIGSQSGAQAAIDVIKGAINYVSGIRGDLGAIQNRLEHTGNNLSVMAENIQDAESTIRDTDVAEEMMSYVKNNILVQSAQAMLAQANQVPQGVLQLLG